MELYFHVKYTWSLISDRGQNFYLRHCVQTGSRTYLACYATVTGDSSPRLKRLGREADHRPAPRPVICNARSYGHALLCLHDVLLRHKDNFTFFTFTLVLAPARNQIPVNQSTESVSLYRLLSRFMSNECV
jgi:hypothetical protein